MQEPEWMESCGGGKKGGWGRGWIVSTWSLPRHGGRCAKPMATSTKQRLLLLHKAHGRIYKAKTAGVDAAVPTAFLQVPAAVSIQQLLGCTHIVGGPSLAPSIKVCLADSSQHGNNRKGNCCADHVGGRV